MRDNYILDRKAVDDRRLLIQRTPQSLSRSSRPLQPTLSECEQGHTGSIRLGLEQPTCRAAGNYLVRRLMIKIPGSSGV